MSNTEYKNTTWDQYARCHLSVLTSFQWALFKEAASYLTGDVVDCGCGTARLAPLLADQNTVNSYTGIDYSPEMVNMANWVTSNLSTKSFNIIQNKIENISGRFSSAVSIHSYYTWPDTGLVLSSIYQMLLADSYFVLVTPSPDINMKKLLVEAEKELFGHPDFALFRELNLLLSENRSAKFVSMDALIDETRRTGFKIIECHQKHYLGGVNFLVLRK
jgi:SAM-dependent methyltransferase